MSDIKTQFLERFYNESFFIENQLDTYVEKNLRVFFEKFLGLLSKDNFSEFSILNLIPDLEESKTVNVITLATSPKDNWNKLLMIYYVNECGESYYIYGFKGTSTKGSWEEIEKAVLERH